MDLLKEHCIRYIRDASIDKVLPFCENPIEFITTT